MIAGQGNMLLNTYVRQTYLISEIQLLKNLEEVRIKTVVNEKASIFRLFQTKEKKKDIIAKIADVSFTEQEYHGSPLKRVAVGKTFYYCHKNASKLHDFELLDAVLNPKVTKISC